MNSEYNITEKRFINSEYKITKKTLYYNSGYNVTVILMLYSLFSHIKYTERNN